MERTLSQEERIRRAEEIYYKRQNMANSARTATVNITPKKNYRLLRKIIIQIIICVGIYFAIYELQNNTDSFSVDSINYLKNAMAYDVDLNKAFNDIKNYLGTFNLINEINQIQENNINENTVDENISILQEATLSAQNQVMEKEVVPQEEPSSDVSQMEQDANYIKSNFSFIKPVEGPVTSRFGLRNPTTETVPKNHTGIDIGVPEGTIIVAAMEGTVEVVSTVGDYRKSYENN